MLLMVRQTIHSSGGHLLSAKSIRVCGMILDAAAQALYCCYEGLA